MKIICQAGIGQFMAERLRSGTGVGSPTPVSIHQSVSLPFSLPLVVPHNKIHPYLKRRKIKDKLKRNVVSQGQKMRRNYKGISINTSKNTHETVFEMIGKNTNKTVIDIPSGSGAFVLRLKDEGFKNIIALDIENILEIEHDNFMQTDMTKKLPLPDNSCDILVCIDGIEHISEQFHFVSEANRVLTHHGEIIISTPNISGLRSRWAWFLTGHHHKCNSPLDENNPNPLHHIGMISFPELRYLLHTNGFRIDEVRTNRIKPVSLFYAVFLPVIYIYTLWVYIRTGKKEDNLKMKKSIFNQTFSKEILFGETLIVKAIKTNA
jgi:SAM-dependent methyltransferase